MYRIESPWFWPLFGLPYRGVIEASEDGVYFPDSGQHLRWQDGVVLSMARGALGRVQLGTGDSGEPRTVGLTWPWRSAAVARQLEQLRDAALRQFLNHMAEELRRTDAALRGFMGHQYVPNRIAELWLSAADRARSLYSVMDAVWVPADLRPCLAALEKLARGGRGVIESANVQFTTHEKARLTALSEYSELTSEQLDAIVTLEDATLVVASAGSGKTRVIEKRVQYLVEQRSVLQEQILVLAFNRAVAREVGERLAESGLPRVAVKTFHAMGLRILSDVEGRAVGLAPLADPDASATLAWPPVPAR